MYRVKKPRSKDFREYIYFEYNLFQHVKREQLENNTPGVGTWITIHSFDDEKEGIC